MSDGRGERDSQEEHARARSRRGRKGGILRSAAQAMTVPRQRLVSRSKKTGLTPGSVIFTGAQKVDAVTVDVLRYDADETAERRGMDLEDALRFVDAGSGADVTWINVNGLHETEVVEHLGARYAIHPLTLEDVVSVGQRPKADVFDEYLYVTLRMLGVEGERLDDEQLSVVLGQNVVITFQERPGDAFEPLRDRIRKGKGRIRTMGADYLAYALLDIVVDNYFVVIEHLSDRMDAIEGDVFDRPEPAVMERISRLKHEALHVRRAVWPVRDLMSSLQREESPLFTRPVQTFLRDVYDHVVQAIDALESLREILGSLQDAYLSSLSYRMNEVMKVLTIIATIFIPLTFVAGVYGMNFEHMPELRMPWAYPAVLALMLGVGLGMLWWFRRKRWI